MKMTTQRVHYREGQRLRAADLQAEQAYHAGARRRHHLGGHTWGIVYGLAPAVEGIWLVVQPGLAIDGYGRELLLAAATAVDPADLGAALAEAGVVMDGQADLWLVLAATLDAAGRRWRDEAALHVTAAAPGLAPPPPFDVPPADVDVELWRDLPERPFPIFLGRLTNANPLTIDLTGRPYAALVGDSVVTPDGGARLRLADGPRGRFSLDLLGQPALHLSDTDGLTTATVRGDVSLALEPPDDPRPHAFGSLGYPQPMPQPAAPRPWSLYRTEVPILGPDGQPTADPPIGQLRLDMFNPGGEGNPALQRLSIGFVDGNDEWQSCLTLRADCTVEVRGDVEIAGEAVEMPIPADPSDPRFFGLMLGTFQNSLAAAGDRLSPTLLEPRIVVNLAASNPIPGGAVMYQVAAHNGSQQAVSTVSVTALVINPDNTSVGPTELLQLPSLAGETTSDPSDEQTINLPNSEGSLLITATVTAFPANIDAITRSATVEIPISNPGDNN